MNDRIRYTILGLALATLMLVAYLELRRIAAGNLFLPSITGENPPSRVELADARRTATAYTWPALIAILAVGTLAIGWFQRQRTSPTPLKVNRWLLMLFSLGVIADLASTVYFFHRLGIDHEVHPAIRLLGYAYGRTWGPILGKAIQAAGVVWIAALLPKYGNWTVLLATSLYFAAAVFNIWHG